MQRDCRSEVIRPSKKKKKIQEKILASNMNVWTCNSWWPMKGPKALGTILVN